MRNKEKIEDLKDRIYDVHRQLRNELYECRADTRTDIITIRDFVYSNDDGTSCQIHLHSLLNLLLDHLNIKIRGEIKEYKLVKTSKPKTIKKEKNDDKTKS